MVLRSLPSVSPTAGGTTPVRAVIFGRNKPNLLGGESPIDGLLGCGDGVRLGMRLARYNFASDRCRPFPYVSVDAFHECVFDLSLFYRHSVETIAETGMVGDRVGPVTFQNTGCFDPFPWPQRLGHELQTDLLKLLRLRRIL